MNRNSQLLVFALVLIAMVAPCAVWGAAKAAHSSPTLTVPEDAHREAAESLLQHIFSAEAGQPKFDAINTVVEVYKKSDAAGQNAIAWVCLVIIQDAKRGVIDRWPCIYVLQRTACEAAIPYIIDVLFNSEVEAMRAVAAEALGMWFKSNRSTTIHDALTQALRRETSKWVRETIEKYLGGGGGVPPIPNPPDDAHRKAADAILQQIFSAEPGAPKFTAIDAVALKYKQSDALTQDALAWLCLTYTRDTSRGPLDRWPCIYVLQRVAYEPAVSYVIEVLRSDPVEAMRAVAAEALGMWLKSTGNATIREAMTKAAETDSSKWVKDTLAKYLGN